MTAGKHPRELLMDIFKRTLSSFQMEWKLSEIWFMRRDLCLEYTLVLELILAQKDLVVSAMRSLMPKIMPPGVSIIWNTTTAITLEFLLLTDITPWLKPSWPLEDPSSTLSATGEMKILPNGDTRSLTHGELLKTLRFTTHKLTNGSKLRVISWSINSQPQLLDLVTGMTQICFKLEMVFSLQQKRNHISLSGLLPKLHSSLGVILTPSLPTLLISWWIRNWLPSTKMSEDSKPSVSMDALRAWLTTSTRLRFSRLEKVHQMLCFSSTGMTPLSCLMPATTPLPLAPPLQWEIVALTTISMMRLKPQSSKMEESSTSHQPLQLTIMLPIRSNAYLGDQI